MSRSTKFRHLLRHIDIDYIIRLFSLLALSNKPFYLYLLLCSFWNVLYLTVGSLARTLFYPALHPMPVPNPNPYVTKSASILGGWKTTCIHSEFWTLNNLVSLYRTGKVETISNRPRLQLLTYIFPGHRTFGALGFSFAWLMNLVEKIRKIGWKLRSLEYRLKRIFKNHQ